jgi:hypothetical protein
LVELETNRNVVGLLGIGRPNTTRFRVTADVLTRHWGDVYPSKLVNTELTKELAQDRFLATILLNGR